MDQGEIVIHMSSQPRFFCVARAAAEAAALACRLGSKEAAQVKLAVTEALANVVRHGYKGQTDRPIRVRFVPLDDDLRPGLAIEIEDECQGVDLKAIKSRPLEQVRPGGLGVHIIQQSMDEVQYSQRSNGQGLCLRMSKYAAAATPAELE